MAKKKKVVGRTRSSKRTYKRKPVTAGPSSLGQPYHKTVKDRRSFAAALAYQMKLHGDTQASLFNAIIFPGEKYTDDSIGNWKSGRTTPRWKTSFVLLERIERRYDLPKDYFRSKIFPESALATAVKKVTTAQQHVLRWHLPDNFDAKTPKKQQEILSWVYKNVLAGSTAYGKYLRVATQKRYSLRFSPEFDPRSRKPLTRRYQHYAGSDEEVATDSSRSHLAAAPPQLAAEMDELARFKRATIALPGFRRGAAWSEYSAEMAMRHYGLLFGALVASPKSSIRGIGIPLEKLTFALLIFGSVWDWFLSWREKRRGFLTLFERQMIQEMMALTREETGWIRQHPALAAKLQPIGRLVTQADITRVRKNWPKACDAAYSYFRSRAKELRQIVRTHRDPFEAIIVVLKAESPLAEYKKIADEVLRQLPDEEKEPLEFAEGIRSYLMLRFGMHLGLRQRNLRELLLCPRGKASTDKFELESEGIGELRWSSLDRCWEVFIPALAFKNARSSFFKKGSYRAIVPNLENLYPILNGYIARHRPLLLNGFSDPGTFFVRTMRSDRASGAYDMNSFYAAWRLIIQRYGIYNPYTGMGAIEGLLPHGPHSVRDVLATHVLKHTGSYELAGFAVHDTPEVVQRHYCRFQPEEKTALAAKILNKVWQSPQGRRRSF
jgi:hypothetical protein